MSDVYSFETKRKQLSPEALLKNATEEGQNKVLIVSLKDNGYVKVYSSDGINPAELLYMAHTAVEMAGGGALESENTKVFNEDFIE
jgi:hypothetical protein